MNAGGFLACHQFVSHVTGYGTSVGAALGRQSYLGTLELAVAPLCFLAGAIYAGWLIDRRELRGQEPGVIAGFLSLAAANLVVYLGGVSGLFGIFGEPLDLQHDFLLLFLLCFACGLQNGLTTNLTGGQVRTTHLTGPTTDIGLSYARIASLPREDPERLRLVPQNWLRVRIVIAFSAGSMIATLVFHRLAYQGFAAPCVLSAFLAWYVSRLRDSRTVTAGEGAEER